MGKLKQMAKSDLEKYFGRVVKLAADGEAFPVDLDEVWPLAYTRKNHAVRDLVEIGTEGVDFHRLPKNGQSKELIKLGGDLRSIGYRISVPCLEWLVARKVRPVFEVYRRFFHLSFGGADNTAPASRARGVDYVELLRGLGLSVSSGSFWSRIRKYPQEFSMDRGVWTVSHLMAKVIRRNAEMRACYKTLAERRERFLEKQYKLELEFPGLRD